MSYIVPFKQQLNVLSMHRPSDEHVVPWASPYPERHVDWFQPLLYVFVTGEASSSSFVACTTMSA